MQRGAAPESNIEPINAKTVEYYTPVLFNIIYAIF